MLLLLLLPTKQRLQIPIDFWNLVLNLIKELHEVAVVLWVHHDHSLLLLVAATRVAIVGGRGAVQSIEELGLVLVKQVDLVREGIQTSYPVICHDNKKKRVSSIE